MLERQLDAAKAANQVDRSERTAQMQTVMSKLEGQLKQEQKQKAELVQSKRVLEAELAQVKDRAEKLALLFSQKYEIDFESY